MSHNGGNKMKELYGNKEKEELVNSIIEAMKEIEDLKDYVDKLNKINSHLVNQLSEELGFKEAARSEAEEVNRLQAENKKLREALELIDNSNDDMKYFNSDIHIIIHETREALKEIG
jgi:regulator of replication initiation timing